MVLAKNYVHLGIKRALQGDRTTANRARSKRASVPDRLQNNIYQYIATLSIGTPGQATDAALDTGSSDLWVFTNQTNFKDSFNPQSSSSYNLLNNDFSIQYVSGSASGSWVTDTVDYGDDKVSSFQFATVSSPTTQGETAGVFGIGQITQESSAEYGSTYPNFPVSLKNESKIQSVAYSLYLDSISAQNGSSVTFGAVDTAKYKGELYSVPFTSDVSFNVDFEVLGNKSNGVLDSGTSLTYLEQSVVDQIAQQYGATFDSEQQTYLIQSKSDLASTDPLVYTIGGAKIEVPVSELFIEDSSDGTLALSILPSSMAQDVILLGDSFLRSAYVVYNLQGKVAGIAQANWSPGSPNFVPITGDTIPGSVN
uniref:Aspartic protease n=1 Tax=Candida apicola TaxID=29830 RepID=I3QI67_CANAP|nr:aspartic protease [Starmerella apicola]